MKKHVYSFVMVLAMMVLAGTSAFAQDGSTPAEAIPMVVGSVGSYTAPDLSTGGNDATSWAWTIYDVADAAEAFAAGAGTGFTATQARFVTSLTNLAAGPTDEATCFINWLAAPSGTYAVQLTASNANCNTVRRFFVSVFDFDVTVVLCNASGGTDYATDQTTPNSWSGLLVGNDVNSINPFEGDAIRNPNADYVNVTGGTNKYTSTYFKVSIELLSAPITLDDLKWRFQFTMPTSTNMSIYEILTASAATFDAESGSGGTSSVGAVSDGEYTVPTGDFIYVPARSDASATADYIFEVRTHNNLGDADMTYTVRVDRVSIELGATTDYNDGAKIWTSYGSGEPLLGAANELSVSNTIQQSPATSVIDFSN